METTEKLKEPAAVYQVSAKGVRVIPQREIVYSTNVPLAIVLSDFLRKNRERVEEWCAMGCTVCMEQNMGVHFEKFAMENFFFTQNINEITPDTHD